MMRKMLQWRKDNGVDAIRSDIIENEKFFPRYHLLHYFSVSPD